MARILRLRRQRDAGWVVLGADELGRLTASLLREGSEIALCIDSDPERVRAAEELGIRVILGNGLEERTLKRAEIDTRTGAVGLTANEETNLLFVEEARYHAREARYLVAIDSFDDGVTPKMVEDAGAEICFGAAVDVALWSHRLRHQAAEVQWWRADEAREAMDLCTGDEIHAPFLPLVQRSEGLVQPVSNACTFHGGDEIALLVDLEKAEATRERIEALGWTRIHA